MFELLAYGQLEYIRDHIQGTDLNATSAAEHAPEKEHKIRMIKKQHLALSARMPFHGVQGNKLYVD